MPEPRNDFFQRVWDVVAEIPVGRVTTYGHIARHLGSASAARPTPTSLSTASGGIVRGVIAVRASNSVAAIGTKYVAAPFFHVRNDESSLVFLILCGCRRRH